MSNRPQFIRGVSGSNHAQIVAGTVGGDVYFGDHNEHKNLNDVLNSLPTAEDAPFYAYERQHDPTCLPDTRVALLQELYNWADSEVSPAIFWLSGLAGTGKSTVARTLVEWCQEKNSIAASFFFSRDGGKSGHLRYAGRFVTSLAVQIANNIPATKRAICDAISAHSDISNRALREQWRNLILGPLSQLQGDNSIHQYILVIDALDECEDEKDIRTILLLFREAQSLETVRLRVFLTSRPEVAIRNGFIDIPDAEHQDFILHSISPAIVDQDIYTFLEHNLKIIARECSLTSGWPGDQVIKRLVQNAGGLFIWAATACRFIHEGKRFASKRLDTVLARSSTATNSPEKHLDEIYITILDHCISSGYSDEEAEELRCMLKSLLGSTVTLLSALSVQSISNLLCTPQDDIYQTLDDLHAILDIPQEPSLPLRLHHPSFRDFLLNKSRCRHLNFWVDEKQAHEELANKCLQLMSRCFQQDRCSIGRPGALVAICDADRPGTLISEVESRHIEQHLSPEIQYACLYWIQHLQRSGCVLHDGDNVHQFLLEHLLHWLEALGWMGKVSEGIYAVVALESMPSLQSPQLSAFIHDMKRFILYNRSIIEQAPLQTYCSALVFAPMLSIIRKQFGECSSRWVQRLPNAGREWNLLRQTLEGHSESVEAITFSPDGQLLASASHDETVKLWDTRTGALQQTLEGHSHSVNDLAFSPDGQLLASSSHDTTVKLWDARTGAPQQTLEGHSSLVDTVAFSPDGNLLVSSSLFTKTVKLWDSRTATLRHTLEGLAHSVNAVVFSPDSQLLALASDYGTVELWDTRTGTLRQTLDGHLGIVNVVVFSPDGQLLASASEDETVNLWDPRTGVLQRTLKDHLAVIMAFSPDGQLLASGSGSFDGTVYLKDIMTDVMGQTLSGHSERVNVVAFSPDGQILASASQDQTVKLWDPKTGALQQSLENSLGPVEAIVFSPDGQLLASASVDGMVRLWDTRADALEKSLDGHLGSAIDIFLSPGGQMVASVSFDKTVRLWDTRSGTLKHTLKGHLDWVSNLAFSLDGQLLASASGDGTVKLWDTGTGALLQTPERHVSMVDLLVFSPGNRLFVSVSGNRTAKLWDVRAGALQKTLEDGSESITAATFSSDGQLLALVSDYIVRLWDTGTDALRKTLRSNSKGAKTVAFSPNGQLLALASTETLKVWDTGTDTLQMTVRTYSTWTTDVAFSPNGQLLASASTDGIVKLWDPGTGTLKETLNFRCRIETVSFSDDGNYVQTNIGVLPVPRPLSNVVATPETQDPLQQDSPGILISDQWISGPTRRILWLPPDYRSNIIAATERIAVFGNSGRVYTIEFVL